MSFINHNFNKAITSGGIFMSEKLRREIEKLENQAKNLDLEVIQKQKEVEKIRKKITSMKIEMKKKTGEEKEKALKKIEEKKKPRT